MRWLVIILLMCNGIYFLWQYYLAPSAPGDEVALGRPVAADEQLRLYSESVASNEKDKLIENQSDNKNAKLEPAIPAVCLMVGPFKEEVTGRQVLSRLAALDIHPKIEAIKVPGKPNYWVHIPPQTSRKVAIKLLRELQAKKIDSFLITEGELENGISLGIFTKLASAEKVSSSRNEQGYAAQVLTMSGSRSELWAVFDAEQSVKFSDALWEKTREGNAGLERRKNYCDKIAPSDNLD